MGDPSLDWIVYHPSLERPASTLIRTMPRNASSSPLRSKMTTTSSTESPKLVFKPSSFNTWREHSKKVNFSFHTGLISSCTILVPAARCILDTLTTCPSELIPGSFQVLILGTTATRQNRLGQPPPCNRISSLARPMPASTRHLPGIRSESGTEDLSVRLPFGRERLLVLLCGAMATRVSTALTITLLRSTDIDALSVSLVRADTCAGTTLCSSKS
mmetsp:Transcript_69788/g.113288  ORF Transcript_69788/g.113288 Transcript_69788/m.113288 type:complete len:216 (-) Transcript_69788:2032-2679(-)